MSRVWTRLNDQMTDEDRHSVLLSEVARCVLHGNSDADIARELLLTPQLVAALVRECRDRWTERVGVSDAERLASEVANLEHVRSLAYDDYELSRISRIEQTRARVARDSGDIAHGLPIPDQPGDPRYLAQIVQTSERICRLLGLEAPQKVDHTLRAEGMSLSELMKKDESELARMYSEEIARSSSA